MTASMTYLVRGLSLAALLMAGSCSAPTADNGMFADGDVNNPITVQPSYQGLKLSYAPGQGLSGPDAAHLEAFVDDYRAHGNGSIIVSAPSGAAANDATAYFADRINTLGIARDHIIVTTHDAALGDMGVQLNYVSYTASTNACGNWSEDLSFTEDNNTPKNFGCSVQQNLAAMVVDPRDLIGPRPMDSADASRRQAVITNYEQGKITSADKRKGDLGNEQSGTSSQVGK